LAAQHINTVKTGRTHLMDAVPLTLGQEIGGWAAQMHLGLQRIDSVMPRITKLAIGGTAVGTGINAHPHFGERVCQRLSLHTHGYFYPKENYFEAISAQDAAVEISGQLKVIAVGLMKISNDLRWMSSGPLAGLGEIELPALQAGSSIMPGKVNPVIPEAVLMACVQVIANDTAITLAGQSGSFQLNTMLPLIAYNLLQSLQLLANSMRLLVDKVLLGLKVRVEVLQARASCNPILATALNPWLGYEEVAAIVRYAYQSKVSIKDAALVLTDLTAEQLDSVLDPMLLTGGGILADGCERVG
jgi:fumarate hydratase class II